MGSGKRFGAVQNRCHRVEKSTTIYDQLDRATDQYGAAPAAWFGGDRKPLAAYATQVPHSQTGYDEGINGLAISVFNNTKLTGAPKLYTTSMNQAAEPAYVLDLTNPTVTPTDGLSMRATGKIRLDQVGTYAFRFFNGGGARLYIDGQLKVDNWAAGNERFSGEGTYANDTPGKLVSITIEAYKTGTSGSNTDGRIAAVLQQRAPGQSVITGTNVASQLTPAYNLTTSQTAFDSQLATLLQKLITAIRRMAPCLLLCSTQQVSTILRRLPTKHLAQDSSAKPAKHFLAAVLRTISITVRQIREITLVRPKPKRFIRVVSQKVRPRQIPMVLIHKLAVRTRQSMASLAK